MSCPTNVNLSMTLFDAYQNYEEHLKSEDNKPVGLRRSSWPDSWLHVKPGVIGDHVTCIRSKNGMKAYGYYGSGGFPLRLGIIDLCGTDWEVVYSIKNNQS